MRYIIVWSLHTWQTSSLRREAGTQIIKSLDSFKGYHTVQYLKRALFQKYHPLRVLEQYVGFTWIQNESQEDISFRLSSCEVRWT